jgi:hypothetical protein
MAFSYPLLMLICRSKHRFDQTTLACRASGVKPTHLEFASEILGRASVISGLEIQTRWTRSCLRPAFPPVHCRALDASHPPDLIGAYRFFPVPARAPKAAQENAKVAQKVAREFLPLF